MIVYLSRDIIHVANLFHISKRRNEIELVGWPHHEGLTFIAHLSGRFIPNRHGSIISKSIAPLPITRYTERPSRGSLFVANDPKLYRRKQCTAIELFVHSDRFRNISHLHVIILVIVIPKSVAGVCTIHDVIYKVFPSYYRWWDRTIYHCKTNKAIKVASQLVVTSQTTQKQVEAYYPRAKGRSSVIYQAVDDTYYSNENSRQFIQDEVPYFVYQSSFTDRKNHAALIEAFSLIQKQTSWNLKLVGLNGPTLSALQSQIESLGLSSRITCLIDQPKDVVISVVKGASGFVYPSLNEGFGIPLAESLAANLPMAVSNIEVFKELVEDLPAYFHPNKPDEMAAAMLSITSTEIQAQQRMKREVLLKKVDAQSIAKQCVELYQKVSVRD